MGGGGPGRELWLLLGIAFRDQVCHGIGGSVTFLHDSKGILVCCIAYTIVYTFIFNFTQDQKFLHIGQLVATSVIQAGATYLFLSNGTFQYVCGKRICEIDFNISDPVI